MHQNSDVRDQIVLGGCWSFHDSRASFLWLQAFSMEPHDKDNETGLRVFLVRKKEKTIDSRS